jgi:hypothetical protein
MILSEGGNVFKTEPEKELIASRIATPDVDPTIKWLEKVIGFEIDEQDLLGTTGKKNHPSGKFELNSSGDLDINIDQNEVSKQDIINKLTVWCKSQGIIDADIMNKGRSKQDGWIHNAGDQVHFRTPIKGDANNGFVQTDFMFSLKPDFQRGAKRGGTDQYGGALRAMLLASLARGRGYKMSPKFGIVDPNNSDQVVADTWDKIAVLLLGPGAKEEDTHTVESMIAFLRANEPNYEELVAQFEFQLEKEGKKLPEAKQTGYTTLEDKQLDRIKELSGLTLNSTRMIS